MTIPGVLSTLDLTNGVIVNMDEAIYLYSPMELPLLSGVGADGRSVLSSGPVDQTSFSWLDEENLAPRSTLAASLTAGETVLTLSSNTERLRFHTGDLLAIGGAANGERVYVSAYGTTAGTLVITRGLIGTAQAFTTSDAVQGVGMMAGEGATPVATGARDTTTRTNVTQIFGPIKVEMTDTDRVIPRYGIPDQWAHNLYHRQYELNQSREQALIYGKKYSTTANTQRAMGGVVEYVTTNTDSTSTQLTVTAISALQQDCYNEGGVPDHLWVNPVSLSDLNDITNTSIVRTDMVETRRGRFPVQTVITEFGEVTLIRNRHVEPKDAFLVRRDQIRRRILRPMSFQFLAKTTDATSAMLVCEESLEVKGEKHMGRFQALSYTR